MSSCKVGGIKCQTLEKVIEIIRSCAMNLWVTMLTWCVGWTWRSLGFTDANVTNYFGEMEAYALGKLGNIDRLRIIGRDKLNISENSWFMIGVLIVLWYHLKIITSHFLCIDGNFHYITNYELFKRWLFSWDKILFFLLLTLWIGIMIMLQQMQTLSLL